MATIKNQEKISTTRFEAKLFKIGSSILLRLPKSASDKLPSRGMTMVEGTINDYVFQAPLEPDGKKSHWLKVTETMLKATKTDVGDTVTIEIAPVKEWPEPQVPADLKRALAEDSRAQTLWMDITPMARWDWIRWIRSTKQIETRKRRVEVAFSKLKAGNRRPCCFNRTECTDPDVSNKGILLAPTV